jgi:hypothetical protein
MFFYNYATPTALGQLHPDVVVAALASAVI